MRPMPLSEVLVSLACVAGVLATYCLLALPGPCGPLSGGAC